MRLRSCLSLLCVVLALSACGQDTGPAATTTTLSPELQAIYDRSCTGCHAVPASGAPQRGDAAAWAPRLAQGPDVLLDPTINGYKAMPPLGACMDCDEDQFRALIAYLAGAGASP